MRLLVIGRTGQLARALAARKAASISITCIGRPEIDLAETLTIAPHLDALITQYAPTALINASAYTAVDAAENDELMAMAVNAEAPGIIAGVAHANGLPLLHVSTDYVFAGDAAQPYQEDAPIAPIGVYGRSKRGGEAAVLASGADAAIVRTAWLFSADGRNFVTTMLRLAGDRDIVRVVADQFGSPTAADDLAVALIAMIAQWPRRAHTIYHFAGSGVGSWADVAAETFRLAELHGLPTAAAEPITTAEYPTPARRPHYSALSCAAMGQDFGIVPRSWQAMLTDVIAAIAARPR